MKLDVGPLSLKVDDEVFEEHLRRLFGVPLKILEIRKLGEGFHAAGFLLSLDINGKRRNLVLRVLRGDIGWGHDYASDRAAVLLLQHRLFNRAPPKTCVQSLDVLCLKADGSLLSLKDSIEFFQLVEEVTEVEGTPYVQDLHAIGRRGSLIERDRRRCQIAADYLVSLHSERRESPILYKRHIRDLIGHGEMLMGVIDTYPDPSSLSWTSSQEIEEIEVAAVRWRNRIKYLSHRLRRIHGDFHPFGNIRFREDDSIVVLDPSRFEYGEPADDLAALAINYIFLSLWHYGALSEPFRELLHIFFERYIRRTGDEEVLRVLPPFFAFRGLVIVHPLYYPEMDSRRRRKVLSFVRNVLDDDSFNLDKVDDYLEKLREP
ncbi:phosphotransferase [Candidatus Bathyarchaeota archaeon]|nr:phosphotransferase [Candidatus Bathyarchaeota archaeon]